MEGDNDVDNVDVDDIANFCAEQTVKESTQSLADYSHLEEKKEGFDDNLTVNAAPTGKKRRPPMKKAASKQIGSNIEVHKFAQ